ADDHRAVLARIDGDLARRGRERLAHDLDAGLLVVVLGADLLQRLHRTHPGRFFWWSFWGRIFFSVSIARSRATPPPGRMPSSTAARVACIASSTRSLRSFTSTSVAPPTRITATPPASLARRSCSFSRSYSEVVSSICALICETRASMSAFLPAPLTIVVFSLSIITFLARPSICR